MKFEFSDIEVKSLKQLIDLAIRAQGIQGGAAEAGVILTKKLDMPIKEKTEKKDGGEKK
jgi:hypothetical protein